MVRNDPVVLSFDGPVGVCLRETTRERKREGRGTLNGIVEFVTSFER